MTLTGATLIGTLPVFHASRFRLGMQLGFPEVEGVGDDGRGFTGNRFVVQLRRRRVHFGLPFRRAEGLRGTLL